MATREELRPDSLQTQRHRTVWLESGPADGPLMIFIHS